MVPSAVRISPRGSENARLTARTLRVSLARLSAFTTWR